MATLDRWRRFLAVPQTLSFPRLSLMGDDNAPHFVVGSGEVRLETLTRTTYRLVGEPADPGYVMTAFRRHEENPYDGLSRMRLIGTDAEGVEWALGRTMPQIRLSGGGDWTFTGDIEALIAQDEGEGVARESTTELVFPIPPEAPMHWVVDRFARGNSDSDALEFEVLGSRISFRFDPKEHTLTIVAQHSAQLPPTYTENWLGEPFRILFGQLIYPRIVARNLGQDRAIVFVRPAPGYSPEASWAALWRGDGDPHTAAGRFWALYWTLLTYIANARDAEGERNFEANKVTRLYEEIIQASRGSKWVWAMTFASGIEGMVRLLYPRGTPHPDADKAAAQNLIRHIDQWAGNDRLRRVARGAVERSSELPAGVALRRLRDQGVVTSDHYRAWNEIRNAVMHGSLVSPYSTEREDNQLLDLAAMFHALTMAVVQRSAPAAEPG